MLKPNIYAVTFDLLQSFIVFSTVVTREYIVKRETCLLVYYGRGD